MNWFKIIRAMPHQTESCKNCGKEFSIDLLWEEDKDGHHFINNKGRVVPQGWAKRFPKEIIKEYSETEIKCPHCGYVWSSIFEQDYKDGKIEEMIVPIDSKHHFPQAVSG